MIGSRFAFGLESCIPFKPKYTAALELSAACYLLAAEAGDPMQTQGYSTVGHNDALAFDGVPFLGDDVLSSDGKGWAASLRDLFRASSPDAVYDKLTGAYSIAYWSSEQEELTAFGDFSGTRPVFFFENEDFFGVSNRQTLLNPVLTPSGAPSFDPIALSWLLTQANIFGRASPFAGVTLLRPGEYLTYRKDGGLHLRSFARQAWNSEGPPDYDRAFSHLRSQFTAFGRLDDGVKLSLSLTGGKDSRLVLAMAHAAGLTRRLSVFTGGFEGSGEIKVAQELCGQLGLEHRAVVWQTPTAATARQGWDTLRAHGFRYEASPGGWDGAANVTTSATEVELTGVLGEAFKRVWPATRKVSLASVGEAKAAWTSFQQPTDPFGVVREEVKARQQQIHDAWIDDRIGEGVDLDVLHELYYLENRMPWWAGCINANYLYRLRLAPLADLTALRECLASPVGDRQRERFHIEMLRRSHPGLLATPLYNDAWAPATAAIFPEMSLPTTPYADQSRAAPVSTTPWQIAFVRGGGDEIRDYLLSDRSSPLFDICDPQALERALADTSRISTLPSIKTVLNLVSATMAIRGDWTRARDDLRSGPGRAGLVTNLDALQASGLGRTPEIRTSAPLAAKSPPPAQAPAPIAPPRPAAEIAAWPQSWIGSGAFGAVDTAYRPTYSGDAFQTEFFRAIAASPATGSLSAAVGIRGWLLRSEAQKLYELAFHAVGDILELGTYAGLSTYYLAKGIADSGRSAKVASVDISHESANEARSNLRQRDLGDRAELLVGDAEQICTKLIDGGRRFGFAFIDHSHRYDDVAAACDLLESLCAPGALCLFHDYNDKRNQWAPSSVAGEATQTYGVFPAVVESMARRRWRFLGVFGSAALVQLPDSRSPEADALPPAETPLTSPRRRSVEFESASAARVGTIAFDLLSPGELRNRQSTEGRFLLVKTQPLVQAYERTLRSLKIENLFEIGIQRGGSTAFMNELFEPRRHVAVELQETPIPALDSFAARVAKEGRVLRTVFGVDQGDKAAVREIARATFGDAPRPLDLVVDDASHLLAPTRASFEALFPLLRHGGVYLLEDWGWAHWTPYQGPEANWRDQPALSNLVMAVVMLKASRPDFVESITFESVGMFVTRGKADIPEPFDVASSYLARGRTIDHL